ncbi:MAG: hypothetical protein V1856_03645 [Candidatus Liptonbacteria bacterium]
MEVLSPRGAEILQAVIKEYIVTGEPVSSDWLYEHHDFGIRPAMIRLELNDLTERGFLEQPHPAAGRVPSNKGYEFFARQALTEQGAKQDRVTEKLMMRHSWDDLAEAMSQEMGVLAAVMRAGDREIHKGYLENLLDNLEWQSREEIKAVVRDFEELDERMDRTMSEMRHDFLDVFVGRKSPLTRSDFLSVMAGDYEVDGERVILCAIGPKRMDYEQAARIFKGLKQCTEKEKNNERRKK